MAHLRSLLQQDDGCQSCFEGLDMSTILIVMEMSGPLVMIHHMDLVKDAHSNRIGLPRKCLEHAVVDVMRFDPPLSVQRSDIYKITNTGFSSCRPMGMMCVPYFRVECCDIWVRFG